MEIEERIESDEVNLTVEEDIKIYKFNEEDVNEDDADAIETAPPVSDSPGKIISGKATEKIQLNEFEENQNNHDENEEDNNENVDEQMDIEEEENQDDNVADENPEIEEQSSVKEEVINDNVADESQSQDEKEEDEDEEEKENVSLNPVAIDTESRQSSEISVPKTPMKRKLSEDTLSSVLTENDENIDFLGFDENTGEAKLKMRFKSMKIEDEIDDDKSEQQENKNNHSDVEMDAEKSGYSKKTEDMKEKNFDVIDSKISKKISSEKRNFSSPRASPRSLENVAEEKINNSPRREPMNRQEIKTPPSVQIVAKSTTETIQDSPASSPRLQIDEGKFSKGSTPSAGGKQKSLKDPLFRKPFEAGWKREFVYRAVPGISKEKGEVYYITPGGKKLRTRNEILQNLTPGLTLDNFTFAKEPLGAKPEEEIIRYAKPTTKNAPSAAAAAAAAAASLETVGKRIPKPKAPKGASPPPQGWTPAKAVKHSSISTQSSRNSQSNRADENESKSMGRSTKTGKTTKKGEPCTIQCVLAMGIVPQLQCIKCLCLYHHECVGMSRYEESDRNVLSPFSSVSTSRTLSDLNQKNYICELCRGEETSEPSSVNTSTKSTISNISPLKIQHSIIPSSSSNYGNFQSLLSKSFESQNQKSYPSSNHQGGRTTATSSSDAIDINEINSSSPRPKGKHSFSQNVNKKDDDTNLDVNLPQSIAVIKGRKYVVIRKAGARRSNQKEPILERNENSSFSGDTTLHSGDDSFNRKKSSRSKVATNLNSSISSSPQALIRSVSSENFASNFFGIVSVGYDVMFQVFQYLTVQELLRAARVCRVWYDVAHHRSLWRTVRMKNSQVDDWKGLAEALVRHETKHLDLRKILMASSNMEDIWKSFSKNIKIVHALEGIELCKCSSKVVSNLFSSNPKLRVLNALSIKDEFINLENISRLQNLEELRLKSLEGITLDGNLHPLSTIKTLKHLGLTSFKKLSVEEVTVIGEMTQLESLELGDCKGFDAKFATEVLGNLSNLKRLRLECGQNDCGTFDILTVISEKLTKLTQLELVNFDIKPGFDEKLSNCINIQRLLIIPTYISQSGATNNIVLSAVLHLKDTLKYLTWAVTLELLKVTALYLDQYDNTVIKDKKYFDESIPVLKPVPGISDDREKIALNTINNETQIEILPLTIIENILKCGLPSTKFKIVKVPYHATWRQNLE